ncbi:MAG: hypothetical protein SFV15_14860 [Polyangiaceae bacterium]|nr:hypothetical protein [Polyangiaceae bacterium]
MANMGLVAGSLALGACTVHVYEYPAAGGASWHADVQSKSAATTACGSSPNSSAPAVPATPYWTRMTPTPPAPSTSTPPAAPSPTPATPTTPAWTHVTFAPPATPATPAVPVAPAPTTPSWTRGPLPANLRLAALKKAAAQSRQPYPGAPQPVPALEPQRALLCPANAQPPCAPGLLKPAPSRAAL